MESQYNHNHQEPTNAEREDIFTDKALLLNCAVRFGTMETVQKLLEDGTDINSKVKGGWTALHSAVEANKEEIVHLLLEKGADPHIKKENGATPFIIAGITGNVDLLKLFLEKGADINEYDVNGFTAFMEAAWYGMEEALRFLYENGADVNLGRVVDEEKKALNKGGVTALMDAARKGHFTLVKALVKEMNADMNICDNQGRNVLIHALFTEHKILDRGKEDIALFLLEHGVDVNKRDENGKTTLILAVEKQSKAVVVAILERNDVDVDDADKNSRTALMVAVETKNYDIAKVLCERGARTDIGNLLEVASQTYNNGRIIALLQKYGTPPIPSQPRVQWIPTSKRWESKLQDLYMRYRPMIGKLKIFQYSDFRIQRNSQGGVYLGFYDGEAVAVKIFHTDAEKAEREKTCLEKCRTSNHLVKICGSEQRKACLYLCLTLCERTLEEYFKMNDDASMKSKDILTTVFLAVNELHGFGFGHQDLHPSNILIDVNGKVFLADFDKSRKITDDDQKECIISEDLKGLRNLVLYVALRGKICFQTLPTECPEDVAGCMEIEDLCKSLESTDKTTRASEQLGQLMNHPYFWNEEMKYVFLTKVGNESDIKTYKTKHENSNSEILKALNHKEHPFKGWTTEKVHLEVLDCMGGPFQSKKKPDKNKRVFEDCVTDLLKLIRDMNAHYSEKSEEVKTIVGNPADYFLNLFPDLTVYVYRNLKNIKYDKHFPNAQHPSHI
ncbi:2-5A-dependent ribonuclease-like [Sceloporus undulatus]|uniref:2-5A-dependent ribonuclease-like n=1 Tax=Sceloporus undulatus TaxID=8520 RepID=UPI001C4AC7E1|nr:2-5A-dependent ribonuclease-like [Sceloporus undulatus]